MGQEVLKKFERYFLLDSIAQGGMAEIYRARPATIQASGRLLVIKRILAGYGKNKDFLKMFESEINVMLGFNHPNIVQLYDFGEVKSQPFIAMEFVDGKNLRQFITRNSRKGQTVPVELACYIIEQVASGLHYAHTFKDKITGKPLNLVHRDISPQNVLVSYDGSVKIIDFGIAKAATNVESTRVGIIKGKPSYLSPEQITGETLDGRNDIFSLGTVLWETLTGKKLFAAQKGESEFAVLKLIESCDTYVKPPSKINPDVPKELDDIAMRALAKRREKRYQTAEEFQLALNRFVRSYMPDFTPSDLSHSIKALFKNEILEDRKLLQKLSGKADQLLEEEQMAAGVESTQVTGTDTVASQDTARTQNTYMDPNRLKGTGMSDTGIRGAGGKKSDLQVETGLYRPDFGGEPDGVGGDREDPNKFRSERERQRQEPEVKPAGPRRRGKAAPDELFGSSPKKNYNGLFSLIATTSVAAALYFFLFYNPDPCTNAANPSQCRACQHDPNSEACTGARNPANNGPGNTNVVKPEPGMIKLTLDVDPGLWKAKATINGKALDPANPEIDVPLNKPLSLVIKQPLFKTFKREFSLSQKDVGGGSSYSMKVELSPIKFGYLSLNSTPSAEVTIRRIGPDRQPAAEWVEKTPIEELKVPAGTYKVHMLNRVLKMSRTDIIEVKDGKAVKKSVELKFDQ